MPADRLFFLVYNDCRLDWGLNLDNHCSGGDVDYFCFCFADGKVFSISKLTRNRQRYLSRYAKDGNRPFVRQVIACRLQMSGAHRSAPNIELSKLEVSIAFECGISVYNI